MEYDCTDIPKPELEYADLYNTWGALGAFYYEYPDRIFVDGGIGRLLDKTYLESIIAHEIVHYLDFKQGLIDPHDPCYTEWNGWRVGNAYVIVYGRPDLADFNWQERYGCFKGIR